MALGEALAGFIEHEVAVIEVRDGKPEHAIEQNLPRGGFEQIGAADNFCDAHVCIVNDDRQLIGGNVVTARAFAWSLWTL